MLLILISFLTCSFSSASEMNPAAEGEHLTVGTFVLNQIQIINMDEEERAEDVYQDRGCCGHYARASQNCCYQMLAATCWDTIMGGFNPGRERAMVLLDIQPTDKVLLVGEGSGLDFAVLPNTTNKQELKAFDFSPEMVKQAKQKAHYFGISEENCFRGDAQQMPFIEERFDKVFFPLSLGSIPDPTLALREAERILAPLGLIVVFEKLVDDHAEISCGRRFMNSITQCIFADINRNLTQMMGKNSLLKIKHYESLKGKLTGCFASRIGAYYRLAILVRASDYPDLPVREAILEH